MFRLVPIISVINSGDLIINKSALKTTQVYLGYISEYV